jgi:cyclic pyranopterin phosphate synthase
MEELVDPYGRRTSSLRVSVTNRCNLDCIYCHREGQTGNPDKEISGDTIGNIMRVAAEYGVNKVKFSGGEPLLRRDFEDILLSLPKLRDVSATTNGVLLAKRAGDLAESGLNRINVSLDTLKPEVYDLITRKKNNLGRVLDGIHSAIDAGLVPIKLNMVLLKGVNDGEIWDMLDFARAYDGDLIVQLIELMDFHGNSRYKVDIDLVEKLLGPRASSMMERILHRRKKYLIDGVEVELVRPIDNSRFCANCNRLRVTSDGKLKPCLLRNDNLVDLNNASLADLPSLLRLAISRREPYYKQDQ